MDLGLGSLIDKIEDYFGRVVATIVSGLLVLVVIVWSVNFLLGMFWKLLEHIPDFPDRTEASTTEEVTVFLFGLVISLIVGYIHARIVSKYFVLVNIKKARKMSEEVSKELDAKDNEISELRKKLKNYEMKSDIDTND